MPDDDWALLDEAIGSLSFDFWACPVDGHSDRRGPNGEPILTVDWRGDVAHCTAPGCGRTSADERRKGEAA